MRLIVAEPGSSIGIVGRLVSLCIRNLVLITLLAFLASVSFLFGAETTRPTEAVHAQAWAYMHPSAFNVNIDAYLRQYWHTPASPYTMALDWADKPYSPLGDVMGAYFHIVGWHYDRTIGQHQIGGVTTVGGQYPSPQKCYYILASIWNRAGAWLGDMRYLHVIGSPISQALYGYPDNTAGFDQGYWIGQTLDEDPTCPWEAPHVHEDQDVNSYISTYDFCCPPGHPWYHEPNERGFAP